MYVIKIFKNESGRQPFAKWLEQLSVVDRARVRRRLDRMLLGNFGDYKLLSGGLYELRFFFGSGYRVYFTLLENKVIVLLAGGDKKTQVRDIKLAKEYK